MCLMLQLIILFLSKVITYYQQSIVNQKEALNTDYLSIKNSSVMPASNSCLIKRHAVIPIGHYRI